MRNLRIALAFSLLMAGVAGPHATAQSARREESIVQASSAVLGEIMSVPLRSIPGALLAKAHGVAIFPNVIKGGFIVGARHGAGVLLVRDSAGAWHAPVFATITGGNIGFQAGLQSTDVVLVFTTQQSVQQILNGQFNLGVDAAAAAGPVGRQASVATDGQLKAEIYPYSRSRGLFAGVSLDGSVIQIDSFANSAYYPPTATGQVFVPPSAAALVSQLVAYTGNGGAPRQVVSEAAADALLPLPPVGRNEADQLRDQLRRTAPELYKRLSPEWSEFLRLPAAVFAGVSHPSMEELQASIMRFDQIAADPRYQTLQQSPQFQSTRGLLRHYYSVLGRDQTPLDLPPPPVANNPVAGR